MKEQAGFEDQPQIDVTFEIPDFIAIAPVTKVVRVHRGVTGVVLAQTQGRSDPERVVRVEGIIERWEGDVPITRVEINPM